MSAPFPRLRPLLLTIAFATLLNGCTEAPSDQPTAAAPATSTAAATATAALSQTAPASATELMRRANEAFRGNRIAAPAGDNAVEIFLAVRDLDPRQSGLSEALVELMPLTHFAFEAAIRNRDPAEAERLLALLTRLNRESAVTQSAQAQLAQFRQQLAAQAEAEAEASTRIAAALPPSPAGVEPELAAAAERKAPRTQASPAVVADAARPPAPASAEATTAAPQPSTAAVASATTALLTAPRPLAKVAPDYPPQARSRKIEGFVELEFLVNTNGSTDAIRVVRSEPEGLFDRNAVRALMRWKFKPAERDGVPEAATTRTTMNFRLS